MTPRWRPPFTNAAQAEHTVFRGRAGPLDIWEDTFDAFTPYYVVWGDGDTAWCADAERIITMAKRAYVHLTLLDECKIHQICNSEDNVV